MLLLRQGVAQGFKHATSISEVMLQLTSCQSGGRGSTSTGMRHHTGLVSMFREVSTLEVSRDASRESHGELASSCQANYPEVDGFLHQTATQCHRDTALIFPPIVVSPISIMPVHLVVIDMYGTSSEPKNNCIGFSQASGSTRHAAPLVDTWQTIVVSMTNVQLRACPELGRARTSPSPRSVLSSKRVPAVFSRDHPAQRL